jgi:hypothetical protein
MTGGHHIPARSSLDPDPLLRSPGPAPVRQWDAIPKDFPPKSTIHDYFDRWNDDRTLERIHHALYMKCRKLAGREVSPTAAVIDSQSVKSSEKGGSASIHTGMTPSTREEDQR